MNTRIPTAWTLMGAALMALVLPARAQTIYRCHALDGQLLFQDKPCDQVRGTQEARKGSAGEVMPNAPPAPASDGPPLTERYTSYLKQEAAQRRADAAERAADAAEAAASRGTGSSSVRAMAAPTTGVDAYPGYGLGYEQGVYPPPYYGAPYGPLHAGRDPDHDRPRPGNEGPAPAYDNRPQLPAMLPAPGLTFNKPASRAQLNPPPGRVVAREPGR